jgi:hypothetical protein
VHRKDGDIKGQQPSLLANPLRHNGIIGWRSAKMKHFPCVATVLAERRWSVSPECLAFVQVRPGVLVSRAGLWNPGPDV